ncbi:MAG: DPP IV N-terminal domain-containing protein [Capsulimonadales bacterium]|nr:DPP IV N-terminal domain-containing protein [Capsulimonadales bacterium]
MLVAVGIFGGLAYWLHEGMPLPGQTVPSTKGKIAFISNRNGHTDLFLMNGAAGSEPVAITNDDAEDSQPAFSPTGKEIAFVSVRRGVVNSIVPQVYVCDAMAGRKPIPLTNTSSSKSQPVFIDKESVHFIDGGKLTEHNIPAQDDHSVFPEPDLKRLLADFVSAGGLQQAVALADGERFAMVMNMERGQLLLLYQHDDSNPENLVLAVLGAAEHISIAPAGDGGFAAAFSGGSPLQQAIPILTPELLKRYNETGLTPPAPNVPLDESTNVIGLFSDEGMPGEVIPIPFAPEEISASPDGKNLLVALGEEAAQPGLVLFSTEAKKAEQLSALPARSASFSPDGAQIVFVSGNDIYLLPATGGEATNLTQGKGVNTHPVWSPAKE